MQKLLACDVVHQIQRRAPQVYYFKHCNSCLLLKIAFSFIISICSICLFLFEGIVQHRSDDCVMLLNEARIKRYMHMLLSGVAYMHQNSIMHRDLKPANLLIRYNQYNRFYEKPLFYNILLVFNSFKPEKSNCYFSCKGRLRIADLGLSRIFLTDDDLSKNKEGSSKQNDEGNSSSKGASRRRIRQRQYSHQVATRWYR